MAGKTRDLEGENKERGTHLKSGAQTEQFIRRCNW